MSVFLFALLVTCEQQMMRTIIVDHRIFSIFRNELKNNWIIYIGTFDPYVWNGETIEKQNGNYANSIKNSIEICNKK